MIAAPTSNEKYHDIYSRLADDGVPIVFVDREVSKFPIDCVSVDNFMGGRLAGEHLIQLGRRHLVFVTMVHMGRQTSSFKERLHGFNYALKTAGLPEANVLGLNSAAPSTGELFGYEVMTAAIRAATFPIDAVFTANDNLAYGVMRAVREANLRIPVDVAVVGFDDQDASAFVDPPLTTIRQPVHSVGVASVELLLNLLRLNRATPGRKRKRTRIEPTLVKRYST